MNQDTTPSLFSKPAPSGVIYAPVKGGIDEVGRGSICGPMLVGGVANPYNFGHPGVKDSKAFAGTSGGRNRGPKLTAHQVRSQVASEITPHLVWAIQPITPGQIDMYGVSACLQAAADQVQAMLIKGLACMNLGPFHLEIISDGDDFKEKDTESNCWNGKLQVPYRMSTINQVKADAMVFECSAASIIAKVDHDNQMLALDKQPGYWPYQLKNNMGYHSDAHVEAIIKYGILKEHRRAFVTTLMNNLRAKGKIAVPEQLLLFAPPQKAHNDISLEAGKQG